jgi:molybdate transport system permease protein
MDISPLWISLKVALLATVITFFTGIYAARLVVELKHLRGLFDGFFTLPLVLPPTVVGFFLLLIFGKNGWLGRLLGFFEISVVFSWVGAVIASTVVSFPLMYRTVRGALEQIDLNLIYAARTMGMSEGTIFWKIIVPLSWPSIAAGGVLAFARALGEFGATIMLAGNIPGKTRTMSVAVYSAVQAGDRALAYRWVMIIMLISFTSVILMNYWAVYQNQLDKKWREKNAKG